MIVQKEIFGEGKHVEFKSEIPKKHEKFLKDIIAFANTSGERRPQPIYESMAPADLPAHSG